MVSQSADGDNGGDAAYVEIGGNDQHAHSSNAQYAEVSGQESFTGFSGSADDGANP